jgi:hypothetical protein
MSNKHPYFLCFILLLCWFAARSQETQKIEIFRLIEENKTDSIQYFLEQGNNINGIYPQYTLLEMAIAYNQIDVVNWLIEHNANVNLINNRSTPLLLSVSYSEKYQSNRIVETLVSHKANVNYVGLHGFTPLILACKIKNTPAAKFLFENGADTSKKDRAGNDFFYYVLRGNDPSLVQYFASRGFEIPRTSSLKDGPYIEILKNGGLEVLHMRYDSLSDRADWLKEERVEENGSIPDKEVIETLLKKTQSANGAEYRKVESIFVVSDIHGHYPNFIELLKANKIIDKNHAWSFGKGHLVIAGDVFDRGDQVTECLWLIFKLEYQAEKSGGRVHFLLGNHELMILKDNDKTYANDKYILPYAKALMDYHDLFSHNYVLGQWIRSKNIAVKINDHLFVHGGIPPEFVGQKRTLDQMNRSIHEYMADTSGITPPEKDLIIEPTWYRGYFEKSDKGEDLSLICKYYKVNKIIVGHTPVNQIKSLQDNYVIGVGIHFTGPDRPAQGLLIRDGQYFRCDEAGKTTQL